MASQIWSDEEQGRIEAGLGEYIKLASQIGAVAGVEYADGRDRDLFTFIDARDEDVMEQILDIEDHLFEMFNDVLFDFHIRYLEGRPLIPASRSQMLYRRGQDA
jgi:hypothetical protein